jgi:hypothetical protein
VQARQPPSIKPGGCALRCLSYFARLYMFSDFMPLAVDGLVILSSSPERLTVRVDVACVGCVVSPGTPHGLAAPKHIVVGLSSHSGARAYSDRCKINGDSGQVENTAFAGCDFSHFKMDPGLALSHAREREISMCRDNHTQAFTVFGGAYVGEDHGSSGYLPATKGNKRSAAKMLMVAGLLMFGITAATATKTARTSWDGMRPQASSYSTWMTASFADAVY